MKHDLPAEVLPQLPPPRMMKALLTLIVAALLLISIACSGEKGDKEPTVTVQVVPVEKTTIQHVIKTQAILFPRQQAAIGSKISAPVQKFLIKRGSVVHKGQLLAVLENRDLSAAAQENKGAFSQAEATYATTTAAGLPEEMQKAEADAQQTKQPLEAQEKVFQSRHQLYQEGAFPRKDLDHTHDERLQPHHQHPTANRHT